MSALTRFRATALTNNVRQWITKLDQMTDGSDDAIHERQVLADAEQIAESLGLPEDMVQIVPENAEMEDELLNLQLETTEPSASSGRTFADESMTFFE